MKQPSTGEQALIAVSVTTILYWGAWQGFGAAISPYATYFRAVPVSTPFVGSFFGSFFAAAAILFVALFVAVRRHWVSGLNAYRIAGFLIATRLIAMVPVVQRSHLAMLLCALAVGACVLRWSGAAAAGKVSIVMGTGLFAVTAATSAWNYAVSPSEAELRDRMPVSSSGARAATRIVWLLFDEFDYEIANGLRPPSVQMPEFDRLARESLSATDAHSPTDWTSTAVPSFFIGDRVTEADPSGPGALGLKIRDNADYVPWETRDNLFTQARKHGLRSAIVGWHHPYCRMFGGTVDACSWTPNVDATDSLRHDFVLRQTGPRPLLPGQPAIPDHVQYEMVAAEHVEEYRQTKARAVEALKNPDLNFVFLHWLIPHPPGIYDRRRNRLEAAPGLNYLDNLELVDATIGEVRRTLEQAGAWDQTALIVTGDHPLRKSIWSDRPTWTQEEAELVAARRDPRVPLLIKVPGQKSGATYSAAIDAVLIHELMSAWMAGRCTTVQEVRALFDRHRERFPVHRKPASGKGLVQATWNLFR